MKLILASNSPRRKEILKRLGIEFKVIPSNYQENESEKTGEELAKFFAQEKAKDVFNSLENKNDVLVLGADTVVCLGDRVLGKPKDRLNAINMLSDLSNKTHKVITGYALIGKNLEIVDSDTSLVTFNELSKEQIIEYIDKANPLDKAGSYGIQDGYNLVKEYKGSFDNIVGLPSEKISLLLKKFL